MDLHVLLMLSSRQPPPPEYEVRWHADECIRRDVTYLITTRTLRDLTPGKSIVAFYGDAALRNQYLGRGVYLDYIPLHSPQGQELICASSLYSAQGRPEGAKAFIKLRDMQTAQPGETLDSLRGIIKTTGQSLTLANLPPGQARGQVYYRGIDEKPGKGHA